ncbi:hypothetical protein D7S86_18720 [Pararobbsia silviterrae]|uniref:Uncharacterized protein n=1 Tax=Pararobbsia silviterrae TaxID=1792498 RepID=A0A494XHR8_9BURK|nr:hypothetical protein D7S86_18720 [Pararobbsia silviterrae]
MLSERPQLNRIDLAAHDYNPLSTPLNTHDQAPSQHAFNPVLALMLKTDTVPWAEFVRNAKAPAALIAHVHAQSLKAHLEP